MSDDKCDNYDCSLCYRVVRPSAECQQGSHMTNPRMSKFLLFSSFALTIAHLVYSASVFSLEAAGLCFNCFLMGLVFKNNQIKLLGRRL
jgi:hypothetical protein